MSGPSAEEVKKVSIRSTFNLSYALPPAFSKAEWTLGERFVNYLLQRGNPSPYTEVELGKAYEVFDCIAKMGLLE